MTAARLCLAAALAALLGLAPLSPARGDEPTPAGDSQRRDDIFPLSAVKPGLRGYGLTVKSGTRIERFEVEVIDVIRNYLVKQDVILVKCLGEAFADHQVAQGMSGSPIYFDGKCAGALSYTWSWAKHPLAGITPIEEMLAEGARPLEGRPTGMDPATPLRRPAGETAADGTRLRPIGTPLSVSGFSPASQTRLQAEFAAHGFHVCGGGTTAGGPAGAGWANLDAPMEPGSALVVDLMRGDYNISAMGTCTFVDGDKVYGFGHPFSSLGETLLPMSVGYVYTIVASRQIAFKVGGSIRQVGAVIQDRPSCIVGVTGREARMVPIRVKFTNAVTKRTESFSFEVAPNRLFFSQMVISALRDAFERAETTLGPNTKRYTMTVKIEGMEPWSYDDVIAGFDGGFQRQLMGLLDAPLNHNTQRPRFESFDLDIVIEHRDRRAFFHSAVASKDEVRPGETVTLTMGFEEKDGGRRFTRTMDVTVPDDAPEGDYAVQVIGGDYVPPETATPVDIAALPKLYAGFYKSTEIIAVLPTGRVDLDLGGQLYRNLPLSSLPRLIRAPGGTDGKLKPVTEKVRQDADFVVAGSQKVMLRVVR